MLKSFEIEFAKSDKSKCWRCNRMIEIGEHRGVWIDCVHSGSRVITNCARRNFCKECYGKELSEAIVELNARVKMWNDFLREPKPFKMVMKGLVQKANKKENKK